MLRKRDSHESVKSNCDLYHYYRHGTFLIVLFFFKTAVPGYRGAYKIDCLQSNVDVYSGKNGIPHIFASSEEDMFFTQGFITARERMFQMDLLRLAGRGELSSYFGEKTIKKDRLLKTIGFQRIAISAYQSMRYEDKKIIDAYTRGVNYYLATMKHIPREYVFLRTSPDRWKSEDTVAISLLMSYNLARSKKADLILYRIGQHAGEKILEKLLPSFPEFAPTISQQKSIVHTTNDMHRINEMLKSYPQKSSIRDTSFFLDLNSFEIPASNWMIFSGKKTQTGKSVYSACMDLQPTLPSFFYLIHLTCQGYDVIGASFPGTPGIAQGFNGTIAWSTVNGRNDELDYYLERTNPDNPDQYLTENGYQDFEIINETLKVKTKTGIRKEILPVKITRHGPIISDVIPIAPENCAMKWSTFDHPNSIIPGFLRINKSKNFEEFRQAVFQIRGITAVFGYADAQGNIGWQYSGAPPIRNKSDGTLPLPGWSEEFEWKGYVAPEDLPYELNPSRGYTATFNNAPGNCSYHITSYYLFERAIRFQEILFNQTKSTFSTQDILNFQMDKISVVAKRWVPLILKTRSKNKILERYLALFDDWDFSMDIQNNAATMFNAFYAKLMANTFKDEIGCELWEQGLARTYLYHIPDLALTKIMYDNNDILFDDISTPQIRETRDDIVIKSIHEAINQLREKLGDDPDQWQWGKVHRMVFRHPLGNKLSLLNLKPISTQGALHTIYSGFWDNGRPFEMVSGGVFRFTIDFSAIERSTFMSPPGQSGHYLSPFYSQCRFLKVQYVIIFKNTDSYATLSS